MDGTPEQTRAPLTGQLVSEDTRQAELKATYLALGKERSIAELSNVSGVVRSVLGRYRKQNNWDQAARDYDMEVVRRALEADTAAKAEEWRKRQDDQLKIARLLRKKAIDYLLPRELEAVEDDKGRVIVPGMDPMKASLALQMNKAANETEQRILGVTDLLIENAQGLVITPELLQLQIQKALQMQARWRAENDLPAIEAPLGETGEDEIDPLGDYAL